MKKQIILAMLIALITGAKAQFLNMGFEDWDLQGADTYQAPRYWVTGNTSAFGTYKDSITPYEGNNALMLSRWYYYVFDHAQQTAAVTSTIQSVSGQYKYTGNDVSRAGIPAKDTALIEAFATKWNSITQERDTIGYGRADLSAAEFYTPFSFNITYNIGAVPDSLIIHISPSNRAFQGNVLCDVGGNGYCSFFTIDALALSQESTGIDNSSKPVFNIFPNPSAGSVYIASKDNTPLQYDIIDIAGKIVTSKTNYRPGEPIDLSEVACGAYTIHIRYDSQRAVYKLMKH